MSPRMTLENGETLSEWQIVVYVDDSNTEIPPRWQGFFNVRAHDEMTIGEISDRALALYAVAPGMRPDSDPRQVTWQARDARGRKLSREMALASTTWKPGEELLLWRSYPGLPDAGGALCVHENVYRLGCPDCRAEGRTP